MSCFLKQFNLQFDECVILETGFQIPFVEKRKRASQEIAANEPSFELSF